MKYIGQNHAHHGHQPSNTSHLHPEMILPSIEGGVYLPQDHHTPFPNSSHGPNILEQRRDERHLLQRPHPSLDYIGGIEEHSNVKRRKVNDQLQPSQQRPNTILIPLDRRESYSGLHPQPTSEKYGEDLSFPVLDRRIVQLPPKGSEAYDDNGRHLEMLSPGESLKNQSVHRLPHEQIRIIDARPGQPQSLRRPTVFHSAHDPKSPTFYSVSAPLHSQSLASRAFPQNAFGTFRDDGEISPDFDVVSHPLRSSNEVRGKMQKDLLIDRGSQWKHEPSMNKDTEGRDGMYPPLQTASLLHLPARFEEKVRLKSFDEHHQVSGQHNSPTSRFEQQQINDQVETMAAYGSPRAQVVGRDEAEALKDFPSQSLARRDDWSVLQ